MTKKTLLFFLTGLLTTLFVALVYYIDAKVVTPLDRPHFLSSKKESIDVTYVSFLCDCANFVEIKNYKTNPISEPDENDYIYIEPATADLAVNTFFYDTGRHYYNLRLTGSYYIDKGIPATYTYTDPFKPALARVFRYERIEFILRKK